MNSIKRKSKLNGQPQRALNKLVLQESGSMSVRSNGRWRYRFRKITQEEYFQLPRRPQAINPGGILSKSLTHDLAETDSIER